jgi:signal transduction histidine kinase
MLVGIILGLISATSFVLALLTITAPSRLLLKVSFGLFAVSMGIWAAGVGAFLTIDQDFIAGVAVHTYYLAALFLIFGLFLFTYIYSGMGTRIPSRHLFVVSAVSFLPILAMGFIVITPGGFIESIYPAPLADVDLVASTYSVYTGVFVVYALASLAFLTKALYVRRVANRKMKVQRRWMAATIAITLPLASVFNLFLPLMGIYSLIAVGPMLVLPVVAMFFYLMIRHSLFDVKLAIVRTATYVLSLITLAIIYMGLAFVVSNMLLGRSGSNTQNLIGVVLALLLAFIFQPIKQFFDRVTNKLFYRDKYSVDEFFAKLNRTLTTNNNLRHLLERSANIISDNLKAEQVFFFVYNDDDKPISAGTKGHKVLPKADAQDLGDLDKVLVTETLDDDDSLRRMLASHGVAMVVPLRQDGSVTGYLCLGDHLSSKYTSGDVSVLTSAADELVIAIQNALAVQEIKELNSSLQQRIDAATKELRASNAQLQRLDEAKDEFVSMASHQLRTPLTSVKGYISMLADGDAGKITPRQKTLLKEAFTSSERMVQLINDFLNVSRLRTGKFVIEQTKVELGELVLEQVESLKPTAKTRDLKLSFRTPAKFPSLMLDAAKIRQVVMNFIDNSLYYAKPNTEVKIKLSQKGKNVEFTVTDHGIGVPEAEQRRLFNKFFRASNARKQRPDGTGVGLFLAKKVIDAHDGEIIFKSQEGKGSTFGFSLPVEKLVTDDSNKLDN